MSKYINKLSSEQIEVLKMIFRYINSIIETEFDGNIRKFFSEGETRQKSSWINFRTSLVPPKLPTLFIWLTKAHARINLLLPDGTIQRLTENALYEGPFFDLWRHDLTTLKIKDAAIKYNMNDRSIVNYRKNSKMNSSLTALILFVSGLNVQMIIKNDDPTEPSVILPPKPEELP